MFRKQDRDKNIAAGREILEHELSKIGATLKDAEAYALKRFNVNSADELYAGVGSGDLRINQVLNHINALVNKPTAEEEDQQLLEKLTEASSKATSTKKPQRDAVVVEGVDNLMTHLARCCQPIPGDDIQGFVTQAEAFLSTAVTVSSWKSCAMWHLSASLIPCGAAALWVTTTSPCV